MTRRSAKPAVVVDEVQWQATQATPAPRFSECAVSKVVSMTSVIELTDFVGRGLPIARSGAPHPDSPTLASARNEERAVGGRDDRRTA